MSQYQREPRYPPDASPLYLYCVANGVVHQINGEVPSCAIAEMAHILERYQLQDTDTGSTWGPFPYRVLLKAMRETSGKELRLVSELALEMRLLRAELTDSTSDPQKIVGLRRFFTNLADKMLDRSVPPICPAVSTR